MPDYFSPEAQELLVQRAQIREELRLLGEQLAPITDRLEMLGLEDHCHGEGTYRDPMWWHKHEFSGDHEHLSEERDKAQEKVREHYE